MNLQYRIGIIMGNVHNETNQQQLCGILEQAYAQGFHAYVFSLTSDNSDEKTKQGEINLINLINFSVLDGILYLPYTFSAMEYRNCIEEFLIKNCPKPIVSIQLESGRFANIWCDDRRDFAEIVSHLIEVHGCKKIHCLTGTKDRDVSQHRLSGYCDAMNAARLPYSDADITYGDFWMYSAQQLAEEFANGSRPLPDAVACANDVMAIALCDTLAEHGISVPNDLLVTGYDRSLEGKIHSPSITSYSTSWHQLGKNAMAALYTKMTNESVPTDNENFGVLSCRESCGCSNDHAERERYTFDFRRLEDNYTDSNLSTQLLTSENLRSFIRKTYHMTYVFLKPEQCGREQFSLCLCEDWDETVMDGYIRVYRTQGYSDQMIWIDFDGNRHLFPTSEMVPPPHRQLDEPSVTFFTAVHFQDRCFGYALLTLKGMADGYNHHYLRYCREINNGLEFLCIQNELKSLAYRGYLSQIRDELTGLNNRSCFSRKWSELKEKSDIYSETRYVIGFSLGGLHRIKEAYGSLERDKHIAAFADILSDCCQSREKSFRIAEGEFLVIGSAYSNTQHEKLIQKVIIQFEKYYHHTEFAFRPRLHHAALSDCSQYGDGEQVLKIITELLQQTSNSQPTYSEQMHYNDLSDLRHEIYQHPEMDWSVTLCCQRLNISASYFQRIYRNAFGVSCAQDIQKSKLDYAKKLLLNTTDTLQLIAQKCGYDYSHFMRTFKKEIGMTPTEYRRGKSVQE